MRNFLLAHLTRRVPHPAVFRVRVFHFAKNTKTCHPEDIRQGCPKDLTFNIFELRSSKNSSLLCALCASALRSLRFSLLSHPLLSSCSHSPTISHLVFVIESNPANLDPRYSSDAQPSAFRPTAPTAAAIAIPKWMN